MGNKFKPKIYYSIEDAYPPYRVDIVELFGHVLSKLGIEIEWYMRRGRAGACSTEEFLGQTVHLPYRSAKNGVAGKIITKLAFWLCDVWQLLCCMGRPVSLIQVRDKYIAAVCGLLVARLKGVPFVYWCSYPFPEHYLELARNAKGVRRLYCRIHSFIGVNLLYRFVMPLSTHVFVQSEHMKRDIAQYGVPSEKMTSVPMAVPQRLLNWSLSTQSEIIPDRIVYVGTMATSRQLQMLIDAFAAVHARCSQATLLMVGDGNLPHERAALEQQVARLGLSEVVQFTGFVPIEDAWCYAASAAVCVSPIYPGPVLNCGSPTKLFEYMALGRPVVCNEHPEQTVVTEESGVGLCVEWGTTEFSDALVWMLEHPKEAEAMGARGPDWVSRNRTYPIIAQAVWDKYQELLGS